MTAAASRARQGLPAHVTDPAVLAKVAAVVRGHDASKAAEAALPKTSHLTSPGTTRAASRKERHPDGTRAL